MLYNNNKIKTNKRIINKIISKYNKQMQLIEWLINTISKLINEYNCYNNST